MTAAADVVLIAGSDFKSMEIALDSRAGMNGIAVPGDVAAEGGGLRAPSGMITT